MTIIDTMTASIPATKTRSERSVSYTANLDRTQPHHGTLTVVEWSGVRVKRNVTTKYHVRELNPIRGVRQFECCLMSCTGLEGTSRGAATAQRIGGVYETAVAVDGAGDCTCPAGEIGRHECVHVMALHELIETGGMEDPMADAPREVWPSAEQVAAEDDDSRPFAPESCVYPPGSERRLAVEEERERAGFRPWHPDDMPF